jgi:septal ring factor EnvC (AmiA/AmiB activator)
MIHRRRTHRDQLLIRGRPRRAVLLVALGGLLALGALLALAAAPPRVAADSSISQLNSSLGSTRAQERHLASSVGSLSGLISSLDGQISLIEGREADVRAELATDRAHLHAVGLSLERERSRLAMLRRRLARARMILSRQLVSSYESAKPDLLSVLFSAHGFSDLLNKINFIRRAQAEQQRLIRATQTAKAQADAAAKRLAKLVAKDRTLAAGAELRARALAGMNGLLQQREGALAHARAAQQAALDAARARGARLQADINRARAQQAAAARAAAAAADNPAPSTALGATGGSGGWSIPYAIVLCESGGQNLPPNSAGASGYYQIIPSTWSLFGGTGPAAYLASKSEQDAVATRIWNGGAGASNWVCAGIVGIH